MNKMNKMNKINKKSKDNGTLVIVDWDDTLFPTTWVGDNNLNVAEKLVHKQLINYFNKLDILIHTVLLNLSKCGKVIIVTNATKKWVFLSAFQLPKTRQLLETSITVVSARDMYKDLYPDSYVWKKLVFKNLVLNHLMNNINIDHVISVGDADYEYKALVNLDNIKLFKNKKDYVLKSVKLIRYPSLELLLDQLITLNKSVKHICDKNSHMDLTFNLIQQ